MKIHSALKYALVLTVLTLIIVSYSIASNISASLSSTRIVHLERQYAADFSDNKVLVGASHNIFIGRVIQSIGTKERGAGPETQFEVEVIDNVKGDLKRNVVVDQEGGYRNGVLYVVGDDSASKDEDYALQPGSTYLFATRYNEKENWYTLNSYPTAHALISSDSVADVVQLKALAANNNRVEELRAAYPNEVLLDADVKSGKAFNSYDSVVKQQEDKKDTTEETQPATSESGTATVTDQTDANLSQ